MTWTQPTQFPTIPLGAEIAVDTETYCEDLQKKGPQFITGKDYPIGISLAFNDFKQYYPFAHTQGNSELQVVDFFKYTLSRTDLTVIGANTRFDMESLWKAGIEIKGKIIDIQVTEALLDENQTSYSLNAIAKRRGFPEKTSQQLEEYMIRNGMVIRGKPNYGKIHEVPPFIVGPYAQDDASLTYQIYLQQKKEIQEQGLEKIAELENRLIPILWQMRLKGVRVDYQKALETNAQLKAQLEQDFRRFPMGLDPWSSGSMAKWISDCYNLAIPRTAKDRDSISNEWLASTGHDDLVALADWRKTEKCRRDFIEGVVIEGSHNGRIHPQWFQSRGSSFMSADNVSGTRSGRIACTNPNLTQIPSRHKIYGTMVKSLFLPEVDSNWLKCDYSSQEPRITLHYAYLLKLPGADTIRDKYLRDIKTDFHQIVTDTVNFIRSEPITRDMGKTINLGLAYGMGVKKLSISLGLGLNETKRLLETYHSQVPFMKKLLEYCADVAANRGYVKTILGRKRRFEEWENAEYGAKWEPPVSRERALSKYTKIRRAGTYKAINSIVQGSAADQTKSAIIKLADAGMIPLLQVYDEISVNVSSQDEAKFVQETMENAIEFKVPHLVEWKIGDSWGSASKKSEHPRLER